MPKKPAAATPALAALTAAGVSYTTHAYEHDPSVRAFGDETAARLGVDPRRLLKTLLVATEDGLAVGVVPVAGQLDLKAIATALGRKRAAMADPAAAQRSSGYLVGGISPVGQKTALPTVVDASALHFPTVLCSGGRRGLQVELAPADLISVTGAVVAAIAR